MTSKDQRIKGSKDELNVGCKSVLITYLIGIV